MSSQNRIIFNSSFFKPTIEVRLLKLLRKRLANKSKNPPKFIREDNWIKVESDRRKNRRRKIVPKVMTYFIKSGKLYSIIDCLLGHGFPLYYEYY